MYITSQYSVYHESYIIIFIFSYLTYDLHVISNWSMYKNCTEYMKNNITENIIRLIHFRCTLFFTWRQYATISWSIFPCLILLHCLQMWSSKINTDVYFYICFIDENIAITHEHYSFGKESKTKTKTVKEIKKENNSGHGKATCTNIYPLS